MHIYKNTIGELVILSGSMSFPGNGMNGQPGGESQSAAVTSYEVVNEYSSDNTVDGESISSEGTDENAIHITDGANVTINNATVTRTSENSKGGDNSSRNSKTGGTGIGLSVAKAIVTSHKGKITAESKDGKSLDIDVIL